MKKMKKILSLALVFVLALALAVPAFAAQAQTGDGSITIGNVTGAVAAQNYKAYRLFDLTLDKTNTNYGYTINEEWKDFFETGAGKAYVKIDTTNDNVALKENISAAELQELAQAAKTYAEGHGVHAYTPTGAAPTLTFSNLPLGYYLVATDAGALQALDTTNKNAVMYEKNVAPEIGKTADKTNAAYGDTVHFTIPVTKGGYAWGDYVITDTMTGLELKADTIKVTATAPGKETALTVNVDYTVVPGKNDFTLTIREATLNARDASNNDFIYPAGTVFKIEYDAIAKKVVEMDNNASLEYATSPDVDIPHENTPVPVVKVANYEFSVLKTDEQGEQLKGATFELHKDADCTDAAMDFIKTGDTYRLAETVEDALEGSERTGTITAGKAKIEGLAAGTYYLKEMAAPAGYNKLLKPVKVEIIANLNTNTGSDYYNQAFDDSGNRLDPTIKMNDTDVSKTGADFVLNVVNKTGTELPSTGGIGTTIFYVVGSLLMVAAVVALIVKKRMER